MVNIEDVKQYKSCRKKLYDVHVCMPPLETIIINKLEHPDIIRNLRGKYFFLKDELKMLKLEHATAYESLMKIVKSGCANIVTANNRFVVAGTLGELFLISASNLQQNFVFIENDKAVAINKESLDKRMTNGCLKWVRVQSKPDTRQMWACFVPKEQSYRLQQPTGAVELVNYHYLDTALCPHGLGDFVVAEDAGGKPNFYARHVVNGRVFANTYNNQGWTKCLDTRPVEPIVISSLPDLCGKTKTKPAFVFI